MTGRLIFESALGWIFELVPLKIFKAQDPMVTHSECVYVLRRLQAQTLPDATSLLGKLHPIIRMAGILDQCF